jgi:hypothetical protein
MTNDHASPLCHAKSADDVYMGFAARDEIVVALNELLEAERAGTRVAHASSERAADASYSALLANVRGDEARWCAMLVRQLERLGATPSRATGAFYAKAMAIEAPLDRLALLNRGQAWVVRRLEDLIPRVQDGYLRRELNDMLAGHRANIDTATGYLQGARGQP